MTESDYQSRLERIPLQKADTPSWPDHIRPISIDDFGVMGVDATGNLYWHGKPIEFVQTVKLRRAELWLLAIAAMGTAMQGIAAMFTKVPAWIAGGH